MTNLAYFDCPAGAAGDMILAAFIDAGLPLEYLKEQLALVDLDGYEIEAPEVVKQGLAARAFEVRVGPQKHHRHFKDIRRLIEESGLGRPVKDMAVAVFERLAVAEGRVHGTDPEEVHFHEVGAVDSIIDMVGAAVAWDYFQLGRAYASPLPLGQGFVNSAHGRLPLPAPATLALLEGTSTYGAGLDYELVTPTGAALLTALADGFGPRPAMTTGRTGIGAGGRDLPDRPNILRLTMGRDETADTTERLIIGETNIDDMNPELFPYVMDRLLTAGALDVWLTPIQMKKGRPGTTVSFLARSGDETALADILLAETTTLGVRTFPVERRALPREGRRVPTKWGEVRVKVIQRGDAVEITPEYEDGRRIAEETGMPLKAVYEAIRKLAVS